MGDRKNSMVYGRITRRLRRTGIASFREYFDHLDTDVAERRAFINALTTNKTHFFREKHHFDYLEQVVIPQWQNSGKKRIRVWSAGCSSGEEPYGIAALFAHHSLLSSPYDTKILATDLDTKVLETARAGVYEISAAEAIPNYLLAAGFHRGKGKNAHLLKANALLRKSIVFNPLNLMFEWPHKGEFDVIFCRNVMIYFEKETQKELIARYWHQLSDNGLLFIGHSEGLGEMASHFKSLGKTMFQKIPH